MATLPAHLHVPTSPTAPDAACITGKHYRITVLSPSLVRLEWSPSGRFEDRASQMALHRDFAHGEFQLIRDDHGIQVITDALHLHYNEAEFSPEGLAVFGKLPYHSEWRYDHQTNNGFMFLPLVGLRKNLGGTARTLDAQDGAVPLSDGLMSYSGITALDDSRTLLIGDDGWLAPREEGSQDWYIFCHGRDYQGVLDDFYALAGPQPLLPRYALGNWWSRYHAYSDQEYRDLMTRFATEDLPFSVAVIDMDWHLVDIDPKYGSGWTGWTWNRNLFPEPQEFLAWLHQRGLKVSLNIHPADGVRAFEDCYPETASAMGIDPSSGQPVNFDIEDPHFLETYFAQVLHPLEDQGVDLWWIDWQQGGFSRMPGLDPLWALNHYHFLDSAHDGGRPMTFSRYAGPGSHRYPIGFSGDAVISWESLAFQPYFTATASNVGYGWWSHDIGGNCFGVKDDELQTRWVQFGVFSPIMRLHSTQSDFYGKEPWRYNAIARQIQGDFMRLRHRMVPYLYTMNEVAHRGRPLMRPMYYVNPDEEDAYRVDNQYWFGTELVAAPITTPIKHPLGLATTNVWLPEGTWIDFFTGTVYTGGRFVPMHRGLESFPLLAKAGAVVPLTGDGEYRMDNPHSLEIRVFAGANGSFELYEDSDDADPLVARTRIEFDWDSSMLTVHPVEGDLSVVPETRLITVVLYGAGRVGVRSLPSRYDPQLGALTVRIGEVRSDTGVTVQFDSHLCLHDNDIKLRAHDLLDRAQAPYLVKNRLWQAVSREPSRARLAGTLAGISDADPTLLGAVMELVNAQLD